MVRYLVFNLLPDHFLSRFEPLSALEAYKIVANIRIHNTKYNMITKPNCMTDNLGWITITCIGI